MTIQVLIKQAGKKGHLAHIPFTVPDDISTLKDLIEHIVTKGVSEYNAKPVDADFVRYLVKEEIDSQTVTGKVGFGRKYGSKRVETGKAVDAALLAFSDGLYRVFINDNEITSLEDRLGITDGSNVVFIRFTFLSGSMW